MVNTTKQQTKQTTGGKQTMATSLKTQTTGGKQTMATNLKTQTAGGKQNMATNLKTQTAGGKHNMTAHLIKQEVNKTTLNLTQLTDKSLLDQTKSLVQKERSLTVKILHHLQEIEKRKLFSDLNYSSLFEYATKHLGYSESAASRRISAMRLIKNLVEAESKIESGKLNLINASRLQRYLQKKQRESKNKSIKQETSNQQDKLLNESQTDLFKNNKQDESQTDLFKENSESQKQANLQPPVNVANSTPSAECKESQQANKSLSPNELLEKLENKSVRQAESIFLELEDNNKITKQRIKTLDKGHKEIKCVITNDLEKQLNRINLSLGNKQKLDLAQLIEQMANVTEQNLLKNKFGKKRGEEVFKSLRSNKSTTTGDRKKTTKSTTTGECSKHQKTGKSKITTTDECEKPTPSADREKSATTNDPKKPTTTGECENKKPKNPRYISKQTKQQLWVKHQGKCQKCKSEHFLQVDHIKPVAFGGDSNLENLRLLCHNCNQRAAMRNLKKKHHKDMYLSF